MRACRFIAGVWIAGTVLGSSADAGTMSAVSAVQDQAGALELLFEQGKRLADTFKYDEAVPLFDRLIATMTAGSEIEQPDLLVRAYEERARARFALGDSPGAEQDFAALLAIKPDFVLAADVSPRVIKVLENVRRLTIGQLSIQVTPPGDVSIDGRAYTVTDAPLVLSLKSGEHLVSASRSNHTPFEQNVAVNASELVALSIVLERVSATISVVTVTEDVEVLLDDSPKGRTPKGAAVGDTSLTITDVPLGEHRLRLRRDCYVDYDLTVTVGSEDVQTEPIQLVPAVATVHIETADREAAVAVDGEARGNVGSDVTVCAGSHVIEVRGARGRFVDRREWKSGESVTLVAELRSAVPIIVAKGAPGTTPDRFGATLEGVLSSTRGLLFYAPVAAELDAALQQEKVPADWLNPNPEGAGASLPKEVVRDIGRRLVARLGVQGLAAVTVGADSLTATLALLAEGSGEPDLLTFSLADTASQRRAIERLSTALPSLVRRSVASAFIDVAGVQGAVVVRTTASSGLAVGDVVTAASGEPVASVAELRSALAAQNATAPTIALDVTAPGGASRQVSSAVTMMVDTLLIRDPALLANRALLDLQDAVRGAGPGVQGTAASIGLAVVHLRLGNWAAALAVLEGVQLPDGPGVSAGTVAYLTGLAYEGLGRAGDAQASFTKASGSPQARLWSEGPLVAALARARLNRR